jgi:hypothetical protein
MKPIATSSSAIEHHFIKMAEGYKPEKKKHLNLFSPQVGHGVENQKLELITPTAQATEQAKTDLKRGLDQTDIMDSVINQDVKRRKRSYSKRRQGKKKGSSKRKKSCLKKKKSASKSRKRLQKSKKAGIKTKKKPKSKSKKKPSKAKNKKARSPKKYKR